MSSHFFSRTRPMALRAILASTLLMLGACAGQHTRLSPEDRRSLSEGPKIYAIQHKTQMAFSYESTGYAIAGSLITPLVAIAQATEGMALASDLKLEDPGLRVRDRLIRTLQEELKVTAVEIVPEAPKSDEPTTMLKAYPGSAVLDVRTTKWGIDNNRAIYEARARLLRTSRVSDILWKANCSFTADKDKPAPATEELKANGGALLKAKLQEAADGCAAQLAAWIASTDR